MNLSAVAEAQGRAGEALEYAVQANELCRQKGDKPSEAWSCLYLGHASLAMGQLEEAKSAFAQALNIRKELGQPVLATEPIAGLVLVALQMNDVSLASRLVEDVMPHILECGTLEWTEEPLRVYLACYKCLERTEDSRADQILEAAAQLLETQASKINDEQSRRMYIEKVPWRREIERAWMAKKAKL